MSNDTYTVAWQCGGGSYLEATGSPAAFNPTGTAGKSLATVLFKVNPTGFDASSVIAGGHLWGNIDGNTGWALELVVVGTDLVLQGRVGNAGVPAAVVIGSVGSNAVVERLILATLSVNQNDNSVHLFINGGRVASGTGTYANSALNPRVGLDPAGGNGLNGTVDVVGCAYFSESFSNDSYMAGSNFITSREDFDVGYVLRFSAGNYDFDHRYNARNGAFSPTSVNLAGALTVFQGPNPTPSYYYLPTLLDGNKPVPDVGNDGSAAIPGVAPITLAAFGGKIFIITERNVDWFVPSLGEGNIPGGGDVFVVTSTPFNIPTLPAEQFLIVDLEAPNDAPKTLNLPSAVNLMRVHIKAKGLANTFPITLHPAGTDTIDGLNADRVLMTDWGGWELVSDGAGAWYLFVR